MTGRAPGFADRPMAAGILLAVFCWGFLLLALDVRPPPRTMARPGRAGVAYMPLETAGTPDRPDARAIWSPVLFSLPTAIGFSREAGAGPTARPPLDPPAEPPPLLTRAASGVSDGPPALPGVPLPGHPAGNAPVSPPGPALVVLEGTLPSGAAFPVPESARGNRPWEAEVRVEFDGSGQAVRGFVESTDAAAGVRAELARGILGWRRGTGDGDGWVRVRLVDPGRAAGEIRP